MIAWIEETCAGADRDKAVAPLRRGVEARSRPRACW